MTRDRDPSGRPRSARPRDAQGRPLTYGAKGEPQLPDDLSLPPAEALALAQQLLDTARPFQAHEVLESAWKSAPPPERDLWQGLAQLAVGLTHAQRGNPRGAAALLRRGADRITPYAQSPPHNINVGNLISAASALSTHIERDGLHTIPEAGLRFRLTAS